ncbi:cyclic pyranopterin monophosphate synthase MoaC [Parablastomonas sp. CN1-191]|uniref:cyclic pyranopterin monophosphate synthase MoaC n=1 Tax=Parablastomonas sp. CN1-191 TaxID=3400908 RepID=UPI003BF804B2
MSGLNHIDAQGNARMIDVGDKPATRRRAVATGHITMNAAAVAAIRSGDVPKGDVLAAARIAGIMGAKATSQLIPLCHPLPLDAVDIDCRVESSGVTVTASAATNGRTGVEMEALTATSIALLTLYDMLKAIDKAMVIGGITLVEKRGGRSDIAP